MTLPDDGAVPGAIEHAIQCQMLDRLGIEWTPGEPFYAVIADEINRLRQREASCRECGEPIEHGEVVFHEECLDSSIIAARAARMDGDSEVIAKRKALVHAFRAIHSPDGRVRVDVTLARNLERAWTEYDAAVIANAQAATTRA